MTRHPNQSQLALLAGGDLGFWEGRRVGRHVSGCSNCANEVQTLHAASAKLREVAELLPENLNFNQLAEEMSANIRLGLAAGEAIARFDKPLDGRPHFGMERRDGGGLRDSGVRGWVLDQHSARPDGPSAFRLGARQDGADR